MSIFGNIDETSKDNHETEIYMFDGEQLMYSPLNSQDRMPHRHSNDNYEFANRIWDDFELLFSFRNHKHLTSIRRSV